MSSPLLAVALFTGLVGYWLIYNAIADDRNAPRVAFTELFALEGFRRVARGRSGGGRRGGIGDSRKGKR